MELVQSITNGNPNGMELVQSVTNFNPSGMELVQSVTRYIPLGLTLAQYRNYCNFIWKELAGRLLFAPRMLAREGLFFHA